MTCAIYCRLSREDPDNGGRDSESIQNQRALLLEYAARQNWQVYKVYADDDYSGADRDRPAWNRMLLDARQGLFSIVLCKNQSRFTRDLEMVEKYIHGLFPQWGIRFVAPLDNLDTAVQGNKKARQISGLINEWYLEDLSDNIRSVFAQKRRAGQFIGSFAAYGYRKDPADHNHLLVDEPAAAVVRRIYSLFLQGCGTQKIADLLNRESVPSPGRYKQLSGLQYRSSEAEGLWRSTTISRILRSPVYLGHLVQGTRQRLSYKSKKLVSVPREQWAQVAHTHQAIVEQKMFDTVQDRLRAHTRSGGTGTAHSLAGKVFCADCGARMVKISHTYKGQTRSYLHCGAYHAARAQPPCTRHSIRLDRLLDVINQSLREHIRQDYRIGDPQRLLPPNQTFHSLARELAELRRRLHKHDQTLRQLYRDKVEGILTAAQFRELNRDFLLEKRQLEQQIQRLEEVRPNQEDHADPAEIDDAIRRLLELEAPGNLLYTLLVERVSIGESLPEGQSVTVYWAF